MLLTDLPDDILHAIFLTPILDHILERSVYTKDNTLRRYMDKIHRTCRICSRIRSVAISTSRLWSVFNFATFRCEDELRRFWTRSTASRVGLIFLLPMYFRSQDHMELVEAIFVEFMLQQ